KTRLFIIIILLKWTIARISTSKNCRSFSPVASSLSIGGFRDRPRPRFLCPTGIVLRTIGHLHLLLSALAFVRTVRTRRVQVSTTMSYCRFPRLNAIRGLHLT
ncbi:unnamed protein product, partial [Mycena citricolor]